MYVLAILTYLNARQDLEKAFASHEHPAFADVIFQYLHIW